MLLSSSPITMGTALSLPTASCPRLTCQAQKAAGQLSQQQHGQGPQASEEGVKGRGDRQVGWHCRPWQQQNSPGHAACSDVATQDPQATRAHKWAWTPPADTEEALVQACLHISWATKQALGCSSELNTHDKVTHRTCAQ